MAGPWEEYQDGPWSDYAQPKAGGARSALARGVEVSLRQIPQTVGGAIGLVGDAVNAPGVRDYGMSVYRGQEEKIKALAQPSDSFSNVLSGEGDLGEFLKYGTGYVSGQAATALATGGVGGFVGRKIAQKGIANLAEQAAQQAIQRGTRAGAAAALGTSNLVQEAGSIYPEAAQEAEKQGRTLTGGDLARVGGAAAMAAGVETVADSLMLGGVLKGASSAPTLAKRAVRAIPAAAAREGVTEGVQTGIERWGAQQNLTDKEAVRDYVDSIALGALGGGLGGAAGSVRQAQPEQQPAQPATPAGPVSRAAMLALPAPVVRVDSEGRAVMDGVPAGAFDEQQQGVVGRAPIDPQPAPAQPLRLAPPTVVVDQQGNARAPGQLPPERDTGPVETGAVGRGRNSEIVYPAPSQVSALPSPTITVDEQGNAVPSGRGVVPASKREAGPRETGAAGRGRNSDTVFPLPNRTPELPAPTITVDAKGAAATADQREAGRAQADTEQERRAQLGLDQVTRDGDILSETGKPFKVRMGAARAARNAGPGYQVVQVDGGFVARRDNSQAVDVTPRAPRSPNAPQATNDQQATAQPAAAADRAAKDAGRRLGPVAAPGGVAGATAGQAPSVVGTPSAVQSVTGKQLDQRWTSFSETSGSKGVPRAQMPQIKAEHRGAMVNFLNARGITHEQVEVPASSLKPTQAEFAPKKVEQAKAFTGGDRSILISSDGHVLDGHHQWLAKLDGDQPVKAIRLNAPIDKLITETREFPSAETAGAVPPAAANPPAAPSVQAAAPAAVSDRPSRSTPTASTAPAPAVARGLSVGMTPNNTEPVTVRNGTVYIGKSEAIDFDTGEPVRVAQGATEAQIKQALKDAGALSKRQKFYGGQEASTTAAPVAHENVQALSAPTNEPAAQVAAAPAPAQNQTEQAVTPADNPPKEGEARPANWRSNFIAAAKVARGMGIDPKGKKLAALVAEIDAKDGRVAETGNPVTAPAPADHSPLRAMLREVGVVPSLASDLTGEKGFRAHSRLPKTFRNGGLELDALAERAHERGFLSDADMEDSVQASRKLVDLIHRELRGERIQPEFDGSAEDRMAAKLEHQRQMEEESEFGLSSDELDDIGYTRASPDIQARVQELIAQAEAKGIDAESILEDSAKLTENATEQTYYEQALSSIEAALSKPGETGAQDRGRSAGEAGGQAAAGQGRVGEGSLQADEGLTSPTERDVLEQQRRRDEGERAEAQAKKEREQRAKADAQRDEFTLTGSDRAADANPDQGDIFGAQAEELPGLAVAPKPKAKAAAVVGNITDIGEKIGGARKDTATSTGPRAKREADERPTWAKRFEISQIVAAAGQLNEPANVGRWTIHDKRSLDYFGNPKQVGRQTFASQEEAEGYLPLAALSLKHRVVPTRDGKYEIWRDISDRKRVKVVDQVFDTHEDAKAYMVKNATAILETNTSFGEADLPLPPDKARSGAERRKGDVKGEDFRSTFGFRGVEFGNWNNQTERQALMNDAYDGLMDLAEVLGVPPKALGLNGDLALAFGARGHGLNSARAHYELERAVINLTKENGAGSLAHEWFHALDFYFGRQDGKASSVWQQENDGTRTLNAKAESAASHGFGYKSAVRSEVRDAYNALMSTMFKKGTQYVEDTEKADKFTGKAREDLARELASLRTELAAQKDPKYYKRNNKPASAEQLAEFDTIAKRMLDGEAQAVETDWKGVETAQKRIAHRWTNDSLEDIGAIYKAVRGRSGFDSTNRNGLLDKLAQYMRNYSQRLKMLADAQTGAEKTRMVPTDFAMNAKELDQGRGQDYWTTPHEMAARAFQGYVEDKIAAGGGMSRFLNYAPERAGILTPWGVSFPYPRGEERKAINTALQQFVDTLQTKETDSGVALFDRANFRMGDAVVERLRKLSNERLTATQQLVDQLSADWTNKPEIIVARHMQDESIPQQVRDYDKMLKSQGSEGEARAFIYRGQVFLLSDMLYSPAEISEVLFHEVLGHYGLKGVFGKSLTPILKQIATMRRADVAAKAKEYGLDMADPEQRLQAAEEVLAEMAQKTPTVGWVKRAIAAIRQWLRDHGLKLRMTDADIIASYIMPARGFVERGGKVGKTVETVQFRRDDATRQQSRWQSVTQTEYGPEYTGADVQLMPLGERDTSSDLAENGLPFGHAAHVLPGHKVYDFSIVRDGALVGEATLEVDEIGNIEAVHDIEMSNRRSGTGRAVMEAILANASGRVRIIDIVPTAAEFWDKMGIGAPDVYQNASTSWSDYQGARALARRKGQGPGVSAQVAQGHAGKGDASPGSAAGSKTLTSFSRSGPSEGSDAPMFSRVVGATSRQYTPAQEAAMRHVGFAKDPVPLADKAKALWKDAGKKLAQGIVDQFAPVKDISKHAYGLLRLAKGASGAFEVLLQGGQLKLTDGVYDFDEAKKGGVIDRLLMPLQGEHHDFLRWIAANRAEQLAKEDREHLFRPEDIAALKTLADGELAADYTLQHGPRAGQQTRSRTEAYRDSLKTFNEFNKNTLDLAEQSGLIDGKSRAIWESQFYVPFYRVEDEGGVRGMNVKSGVVRQQAFKQLKGGAQQLNADLLDNTLMNWAHLLDAAAKNRAAKATLEAMGSMGAAIETPESIAGEMARSIGKRDGVVWFMDEGRKRFFLVDDPYLMTALTSLEFSGMNSPVMKAMGAFKHALTIGVTASPFFKVRNLIRDSVQAIGTAPLSANVAGNMKDGWKATAPESAEYFRLMAGGGTIHFGTMMEGSEAKRVQALVESGVDRATILDSGASVKAFYRKVVEPVITAYNELGNRGEAINRAALYQQLRKQGVSHAEASLQARDLMDFSMQGSFTTIRFLTQVVPFFNARLQGLHKLGRAAKENPARFSAVLGATALLSLGLLAAYGDDDDWKKREDWDRNNFWWFKIGGTAYRIPKPFEIGAIATLAERGAEFMFDKEMDGKRFRENILSLLGDNLAFNPLPQLVKPVLDVYANYDSFTGRPIETMGMERLRPDFRFTERTSMAARAASTALNSVAGLVGAQGPSPVQIDHLIRGYFGWLGSFIVGAGDVLARPATGQATRPAPDYWKTATGGMAADLNGDSSRYVSQMYRQAKELEQVYGTYRHLVKQGQVEEAKAFREEYAQDLTRYHRVEALKRAQTRLNEQQRQVEQGDASPEEKRDRIREINERKDRLARQLAPA